MEISEALPDVRADMLGFGFNGTLEGGGAFSRKEIARRIEEIGRVTTPSSKRYDGYTQVSVDLETDRANPAGVMRLEVHFRRVGNDVEFGDRCAILANGQDMLRGELGPDMCGPLGFGSSSNVLGPQHHGVSLTALQPDLIEQALHHLLEALAKALGSGWYPGNLWLKSCEACRDRTTSDAIADVRVLQHAVLVGTVERRWDEYRRIGGSETDGIPVLRFLRHATGPVNKIYPKRADTRRAELACPNRVSIVALTGAQQIAFTAANGRELILNFLTAANPRVDAIDAFIEGALAGEASVVDLLLGLKPLIDRAAGEQKAKGPPSPGAREVAKRSLEALLSIGLCDANGMHARHAIRRELDALCRPGGPLERHPSRAMYYLSTWFARACAVMRWEGPR